VKGPNVELNKPAIKMIFDKQVAAPYPFGFAPTFHRYRLEEPQLRKKPENIFVCSMADLFGEWVPDEWIEKVFDVCIGAPQHRYLFLTKNPKRYMELYNVLPKENNFFFGTTITTEDTKYWYSDSDNWFLSIEPIMGKFSCKGISGQKPFWEGPGIKPKWVIVGAETGNRKGKVIPKKEWIKAIVNECRKNNIPVFLKNNLAPVWDEPLIQEYPWKKG
jgi:protein gp37